ncbi:MAG: hypothetical protein AB7U73_16090 [Pirellulales bacterium]
MWLEKFITFSATLPDDTEYDENEEIVRPGGRNVAELLREELHSRGVECGSVYEHSFYGWAFDAEYSGLPFWLMLQWPGEWLLIVKACPGLLRRWFSRAWHDAPPKFLALVTDVLGDEANFSNLKVMTRDESERGDRAGGSKGP